MTTAIEHTVYISCLVAVHRLCLGFCVADSVTKHLGEMTNASYSPQLHSTGGRPSEFANYSERYTWFTNNDNTKNTMRCHRSKAIARVHLVL